jgi:hypothetical protein
MYQRLPTISAKNYFQRVLKICKKGIKVVSLFIYDFAQTGHTASNPSVSFSFHVVQLLSSAQGCQMVYFKTQNPNLGTLWSALDWKMLIYFMAIWNIFGYFMDIWNIFGYFMAIWNIFGYFMTIWYILSSFGTFFPVLVSCTNKNLATLVLPIHTPPCLSRVHSSELDCVCEKDRQQRNPGLKKQVQSQASHG